MNEAGVIPRGRRAGSLEMAGVLAAASGALALLSRLEIVSNASLRIDVAVVLIFLASIHYLIRDWRLGLAVLGASTVLYVVAVVLPLWLTAVLFFGGSLLLLVDYGLKKRS